MLAAWRVWDWCVVRGSDWMVIVRGKGAAGIGPGANVEMTRMRTTTTTLLLLAGLGIFSTGATAAAPVMCREVAFSMDESARALLAMMEGEWSGQVQVRDAEGRINASNASASMRLENGGSRLAAQFEGFAGGKEVSASAIFGSDGDRLGAAWVDTRFSQAISFAGEAEGKVAAIVSNEPRLRQVVKMLSDSRVSIEIFAPGEGGREQLMVAFTLDKLAKGEKSLAAASFENSSMLSALRRSQAVASVPE